MQVNTMKGVKLAGREWKNEALAVASIYRICTSVAPTLPSSAA